MIRGRTFRTVEFDPEVLDSRPVRQAVDLVAESAVAAALEQLSNLESREPDSEGRGEPAKPEPRSKRNPKSQR